MSSLGNKLIRSAALVLGLAAYVLPDSAPWGLYGALVASLLMTANVEGAPSLLKRLGLSLVITVSVLTLSISAPLGTAIAASVILMAKRSDAKLVIVMLLLQTSVIASVDSIVSSYLHLYGLEAAAPTIIAFVAVVVASAKLRKFSFVAILSSLILTKLGGEYVTAPSMLQVLAAAPVLFYVFITGLLEERNERGRNVPQIAFLLLILCIFFGWYKSPPRMPAERFVLLQENSSAPEAQYYRSYVSALNYAGLGFKEANDLQNIPEKSLLLIPWLSIPLTSDEEALKLAELRKLAQSKKWTVVLVGEHDNVGGVADRVNRIVGRPVLNDDLSVPPKNSDAGGSLRVGGLQGWPPSFMINRGATVSVSGLYDRILLEGDGWWAEKNIHEWLWVGDYLWQPSDRGGRIPLAASFYDAGARWAVIGDSTPFLNTQLLSNPDSVERFLSMVSLWPTFLRDCFLIAISISVVLSGSGITRVLVLCLLGAIVAFSYSRNSEENRTVTHSMNFSAFNDKNFNSALIDAPELLQTDWSMVRGREPISGQLPPKTGKTILFAHVDKMVQIGNVFLTNCRRLGNISTEDGPYLMDAQACSVSGGADVLIGDSDGAAGFYVNVNGAPLIVILDTSFLGQKAPKQNAEWLMSVIHSVDGNSVQR